MSQGLNELIHEMHLEQCLAQSVKVNYYYMRLHQQKKGREHLPSRRPYSTLCWVGPGEYIQLAW